MFNTKTTKVGDSLFILVPKFIVRTFNLKERIIVYGDIDKNGDFTLKIKKRRERK